MEKIADRKTRRPLFTGSCSLIDLKKQEKKKKKKKKKMGLLYFSVLLGSQNSLG
jgi:catechol-2,3-dioxygenase